MSIQTASIHFNENGTPVASDFDDIYFSDTNGLQETRYVFLQQNGLPDRWKSHQQRIFTIAETGFGTGLNFLATWLEFDNFKNQHTDVSLKTLHFITTEKFPLAAEDLREALKKWPELKSHGKQLIEQYPILIEGCHRLEFDNGRVILDLWLGDVHQVLPQMYSTKEGSVDAWYLDGFAPSKNPDMWSEALFNQMARLAKHECTFSTFTAAGFVKRGLSTAGFDVHKRKGFGRKREMLVGTLITKKDLNTTHAPYYHRHRSEGFPKKKAVAVIGAGLAGANCCLSLVNKGYEVRLFAKDPQMAMGASGNSQGGFYPQLNSDANLSSQFYAQAFIYALQRYKWLISNGYPFEHQWCGVLQLAFNDNTLTRYQNMIDKKTWPQELISWKTAKQCEQIANLPLPYSGLYIEQGGWINPQQLVKALYSAAENSGVCEFIPNKQLASLGKNENKWQLSWQDNTTDEADIVVLATGSNSIDVSELEGLPHRIVRGQVESIPSQAPLNKLSTVLCHKGYLTPASNQFHALGSTYIKQDSDCEYRVSEEQTNLDMQCKALSKCDWPKQIVTEQSGRASVRCTSPDHLPLMGCVGDLSQQAQQYHNLYKALPSHRYPITAVKQDLYMLTALGSRGLCSAPLLAEVLAGQISGQSLPMSIKQLNGLSPNRYLIRQLIRAGHPG